MVDSSSMGCSGGSAGRELWSTVQQARRFGLGQGGPKVTELTSRADGSCDVPRLIRGEPTGGYGSRGGRIIVIGANRFASGFIQLLNAYGPQRQPVIAVLDGDRGMVGRAVAGVQVFGAWTAWNSRSDQKNSRTISEAYLLKPSGGHGLALGCRAAQW
jgi:hypothetical protein